MLAMIVAAAAQSIYDTPVHAWNAGDVSKFFAKEAGVNVRPAVLVRMGFNGHDLFDGLMDDKVMLQMGVHKALDQNKLYKAVQELDRKITHEPSNAWEWRAANRRLADGWLIPMYVMSPSLLLIWSRYFDVSEGALDRIDDVVDTTPAAHFWFMALFFPNYPFFALISGVGLGGLAGALVTVLSFVRVIGDTVELFAFSTLGVQIATVGQRIFSESAGLLWSCMLYYVLWWILPEAVFTFALYFNIYVIYPLNTIVCILSVGAVLGVSTVFGFNVEDAYTVAGFRLTLPVQATRVPMGAKPETEMMQASGTTQGAVGADAGPSCSKQD